MIELGSTQDFVKSKNVKPYDTALMEKKKALVQKAVAKSCSKKLEQKAVGKSCSKIIDDSDGSFHRTIELLLYIHCFYGIIVTRQIILDS